MNAIKGDARSATIDHILARSLGGTNALDNVVLACLECNGNRGRDQQWMSRISFLLRSANGRSLES